jgi:hypothetical protein
MEKNIIQWNTILPILSIPVLQLHEKGKTGTEKKKIIIITTLPIL